MASLQTGQRDRSLSAKAIMASSAFIKHTGCSVTLWPLLLLGILLQSVLVSGQNNTNTTTYNTTAANMSITATTMPMTIVTNINTNSTATNPTTAQNTTMSTGGTTSITNSANTTSTSQTPTSGSTAFIRPVPATAATPNSTVAPTATSMSSSSMSTSGNMTSPPGNKFYCPSFSCNYSECYMMYTMQNATPCPADCYCQLMRQMDQCYTVSCTMSCAVSCNSSSQINCTVDCCNSTDCLNSSFASMMMTTTTVTVTTPTTTTTTTRPVTTMATTSPPTTANKGNKCQQGTCNGATCYKDFANMQICSASEPHCQLKQDSATQWTAGCTTNCSGQTPCKASTTPPCHLECCNSTMTSCLWLNGTLNVPSSATRGLHLSTELLASLVCLLSVALLL